jgi:UDP-glucose 4-epimerase
VLDNFATGHRKSLPDSHPRLTVVEGSVADHSIIDKVFGGFQPTHVIHAAAAYKNPDDWIEDTRTNIEGTINIVESAKTVGVKRFVNLHTALGYGRPDRLPVPVDAPMRPFTSYGISKQAGENYLTISNLNFVSLRLANVTGPRLSIGPIPTFYKRLKAGQKCFCSRTVRDFLDMTDFLAIVDLAMKVDAPTGIFNVSTGIGHSIMEIFEIVADHLGTRISEPVPELDPGPDDVREMVLDPAHTVATFGWRPKIGFNDMIRRTLEWYDLHGVTTVYSHLATPAKA